MVTEKRAAELCRLLALYGVAYAYDNTPIKKDNVLMSSIVCSSRTKRVLEMRYEERSNDGKNEKWYIPTGEWEKATIEDFLVKFPTKQSLVKQREVGKTTIQEFENFIQEHGYNFKGE